MARAYQDTQPVSPTPIEVVWQRRPRVRQVPVHFVTSPLPQAESPRTTSEELRWLSRHEATGKQGKS